MAHNRVVAAAGLLVIATVATAALDARRVPEQRPEAVPVAIALKADGRVYNFSGNAICTHAPVAAIFGLRAERWTMDRLGDGALPARLVFWRPASGPDLVSIAFAIGETRYSVNTIKVGDEGTIEGSGTIALARTGNGVTFTVKGTAGNGAAISGTITCEAFTPALAEGGD